MRIIIQRVRASQVEIEGQIIGKIGQGLNLLVGIQEIDTDREIDWMVRKCLELKLFSDEENKPWQRSIQDISGELLVVSQFTLYGDCRKGRRPSFSNSASPDTAEVLYNQFVEKLKTSSLKVETGTFGAMMQVTIENDGPVTLILEKNGQSSN